MSISAENITWKVGKKVIVNNVSLNIEPGKTVGLLGPNGCGKSSLLRILAGLRRPDAGNVTLDGKSIARIPKKQLACRVAFVEQHGMTDANMRVRDVVKLGRIPHHSPFLTGVRATRKRSTKPYSALICWKNANKAGSVYPAVNASAYISLVRWRKPPPKSYWMNPPTTWTFTIKCN